MNMYLTKTISFLLALVLSTGVTFAAGNGSSPKGKPFVAIGDQVVEIEGAITSLQDQIDLLVARVDTVEQRVSANETAITTLENENAALEFIVQQNLSDIASIEAVIQSLQADVNANASLITSLQAAILLVENDVISLESGLQAQIDNNSSIIAALQDELDIINDKLALKQDLVNGVCPDDSAIQQVLPDGSVVCEGVGGSSGQLQSVYSYRYEYASPNTTAQVYAYCPSGYTVTGAGVHGANGWELVSVYTGSNSTYNNYGYVRAINRQPYNDYIYSIATCSRITP